MHVLLEIKKNDRIKQEAFLTTKEGKWLYVGKSQNESEDKVERKEGQVLFVGHV